jgi:hypothetical protein
MTEDELQKAEARADLGLYKSPLGCSWEVRRLTNEIRRLKGEDARRYEFLREVFKVIWTVVDRALLDGWAEDDRMPLHLLFRKWHAMQKEMTEEFWARNEMAK